MALESTDWLVLKQISKFELTQIQIYILISDKHNIQNLPKLTVCGVKYTKCQRNDKETPKERERQAWKFDWELKRKMYY